MKAFLNKLGVRITDLRKSKYGELSRDNFAALTGLDRRTLYNVEKGDHVPNMASLLGILKALNVSPAEFFSTFTEIVDVPEKNKDEKI